MILQNLPNAASRLLDLQQTARRISTSAIYDEGTKFAANLLVQAASSTATIEGFEAIELGMWRLESSPVLVVKIGIGVAYGFLGLGLGYLFSRRMR